VPGPQLLFSSAAFFARPLSATFELIAGCGYTGAEVMVTRDPASQDPREMRRLADANGLTIGAIHAPCLLLTRRVWGTDPVGKIERAVQVAHEAEVPLVVMHPPYRWQGAYRAWLLDELPTVLERTGVTVAIENMFPFHVGSRPLVLHANQDLEDLDAIPHLVLDTSHAAVAKHDLIEVRRRFGERLRHVHLSDNAGKGWDSHLPPGDGVLPLEPFLADLVASGFAGNVSLEVDLRRFLTEPDRLREVLTRMRETVARRLRDGAGS
jgi:sugar phosphate isomerase/epimerase